MRRSSKARWPLRSRPPPAGTSRRSPPRQRRHVMSASYEQVITLPGDLHARPAGALAVAAGRFAAAVSVTAGGHTADAKSVLGVMGLGATSGQHVTVSAAGPDAQEAVAALITILTQATKVSGLLNAARRAGKAQARRGQGS